MALSREYLEYLDNMIEIAPANSQEELQAAQEIASLMQDHGVETRIEEFDAPAWGQLPYKVLFIVMFLGLFMSGLGGSIAIFGMLLTIAAAGILIAEHMGIDLFENVGPTARSQNVVGFHKAEGPLVTKGSRPIVIVAHYDTGRENFLRSSVVGPYLPLMNRFSFWCVIAVGVIALLQVFGFIPAGARRFFWVIGLLAALPLLLLGVSAVATRFSPCTEGANDNKSGVSALLGVLEDVRPSGKIPVPARVRERAVLEPVPAGETLEDIDNARVAAADVEAGVELDGAAAEGEVIGEGEAVAEGEQEAKKPGFVFPGLSFLRRRSEDEPGAEAELELTAEGSDAETAVELEAPEFEGVSFEDAPLEDVELEVASPVAPVDAELEITEPEVSVEAELEQAEFELTTPAVGEAELRTELSADEAAELEAFGAADVSMGASMDSVEFIDDAPEGVRHGKSVIEDLGILPRSCEIEYLEPVQNAVGFEAAYEYGESDDAPKEPGVLDNIKKFAVDLWSNIRDAFSRFVASLKPKNELPEATSEEEIDDRYPGAEPNIIPIEELGEDVADATNELAADADPDATILTSALVVEGDEGDVEVAEMDAQLPELSMDATSLYEFAPQDESGLESYDSYDMSDSHQESEPVREAPAAVEDANWGKSEYEPATIDIARRASLFDLPDPSETTIDPLAAEEEEKPHRSILEVPQIDETLNEVEPMEEPEAAPAGDETFAVIAPEDIEVPEVEEESRGGLFGGLFGRKKAPTQPSEESSMSEWLGVEEDFDAKKDGREIGDWDHFNSDDDEWKGGAAVREGLRGEGEEPADADELAELDDLGGAPVGFEEPEKYAGDYSDDAEEGTAGDAGEVAPTEEEMREAILSLNDDALLAHDIWFVALGASDLGHAGMEAFLAEHRSEIHGAFLVNLDSIGAGDLSLLTNEGTGPTRRADRRMIRLIKSAAADMHADLVETPHDWGTTDATPAMRKSVRGLTIMGTDPSGLKSLSQSDQDILENLDTEQVALVNDLVTEMIRRS